MIERRAELDQDRIAILFCNGPQCPQSPHAIRELLEAGHPARSLAYYRGGMHDWVSLACRPSRDKTDAQLAQRGCDHPEPETGPTRLGHRLGVASSDRTESPASVSMIKPATAPGGRETAPGTSAARAGVGPQVATGVRAPALSTA